MTCNNIRYFFVDGFCSSAGANVLQAAVLLFVWRILGSISQAQGEGASDYLDIFFPKQILEISTGRGEIPKF